jgi:hypothetical protein
MRLPALFLALSLVALGACHAPADTTPNRAPSGDGSYPAGPYGYADGATIADLSFIGKSSPMPADYTPLPMMPLSLADLRGAGARAILIEGGARWCDDCRGDQPAVQALRDSYGPRGLVVLDVLVEGGYGITATEDDINRWAAAYQLSGPIVIDPERVMQQYADVSAFPVYIAVRAADMQIEATQTATLVQKPMDGAIQAILGP